MQKEVSWLLKEKYHNKPTEKFKKDIKRLEAEEPLDYVIGFTEFLGCRIDLSKKPLIPRPETEFWVEKAMNELNNPSSLNSSGHSTPRVSDSKRQNLRILDVFSGSGCIGIAILKHVKNTKVTFAEKDKKILQQIKINLTLNNFPNNRYKVIPSDVFSNIVGKYDYIFANPPYIAKVNKHRLQESVAKYEPKIALFGGQDGLLYIRKFLYQAQNFLRDHGKIYMEFDSIQKKEIEKIFIHQNFLNKNFGRQEKLGYKSWKFYKDQYGKSRYLVVEYIKY